jgi:hypothetical protein
MMDATAHTPPKPFEVSPYNLLPAAPPRRQLTSTLLYR